MRGAFDFETWEWVNPLLCCFIDAEGTRHSIHDKTHKHPNKVAEDALIYMHKRNDIKDWWAHNAGKFDGLLLSAAAKRLGWEQTATIAGGNRVITWSFRPPSSRHSVLVCDSLAVIPSKLGSIAKDFDLPSRKLFTEEDYATDTRTWREERLIEGCYIDCQLILEALDKVEALLGNWGGKLKHTFSSSAMSVVMNNLAEQNLELPELNSEVNSYCRSGYYGARVEVFQHAPPFELTEYDINSSYPYAMTNELPWHFSGMVYGEEAREAFDAGFAGIFEASICVRRISGGMAIPPLPFVTKAGGIYFPTGKWTAHFAANELHYARICGCDVSVMSGAIFSRGKPFDGFINAVYQLKQKSTGAIRNFTKLLLNGSYGKFGEKPEKSSLKVFPTLEAVIAYAEAHPMTLTPIGDDPTVCSVDVFKWPPNTHYAIAAYITAYARMHLHRLLTASDSPVYCDSDSVHCRRDGLPEHECHELLGGLKREMPRGMGRYYAPKIYELRDLDSGKLHFACKGFPVEEKSFRRMIAGERVEKGRMQLAKQQLKKGGLTVARVVDNKRWLGMSMKRKALSATATVPWTVDELNSGLHFEQRSPIAYEE